MMKPRHNGGALAGILATVAVLILLFAGLGLGMGWISWSDSPEKSTIEIDKTEMKKDTDEAADATKKFIQDSANSVEQATEELTPEEENKTITPVPEKPQPQPMESETNQS